MAYRKRTTTIVAFAALAFFCVPQGVLSPALLPRTILGAPTRFADKAPVAYLASPFGFSEAGRAFYEGKLLPLVRETGFTVLDPWKLTPQELIDSVVALPYGAEKRARWKALNQVIARNNAEAIKKCDVVIAVLDGTDVDSGTAAEVGYAAALGKKILGYRGDFRRSGDNEGSLVNLQVEYFVLLNGGQMVDSVSLLRQGLVELRRVMARG
jgi:nucleoside 2-deoxyribosyltransferase